MIEIMPISLGSIIAPLIVMIVSGVAGAWYGKAKSFGGQHEMLMTLPQKLEELEARLTSRLDAIDCKITELTNHDLNDNDALVALLLDNITRYGTYLEQKGWATPDEKKKLQQLYKPYHARGGNGVATGIYTRAMALPDVQPEEIELCAS